MVEHHDTILKILKVCHQPITVKEITEFVGANQSRPIRERVNKMVEDGTLQKFEDQYSKAFSVMLKESSILDKIEIPVQFIRKVDNVYQFVGRIDLFDVPKFCGIQPYRDNVSSGVQRARQSAWTKKLSSNLNKESSVMLNSISIYLDEEKIQSRDEDLKDISTLVIPHKPFTGDTQKPAWIIDGQQRMWAIQRIAVSHALGQKVYAPIPYFAPITILIGNFSEEEKEKRVKNLTKWFVNANKTKNLPANLIHELEARLVDFGEKFSNLSDALKAGDARIKLDLNRNNSSPFERLIKGETNPQGWISEGSMMSIIAHTRQKVLRFSDIDPENITKIYEFLEDFYWCVKIIWGEYWEKPPRTYKIHSSRLLAPVGLGSLAFMMEDICPVEVRFEENREKRVKGIMKRLLKIKDDIDWTNSVLDYQNTRGDLQRFVNEKLRTLYTTQISTNIPEDDLEDEISKLPENFTSTWSA